MDAVIAGIVAASPRNAFGPALITDSRVVSYGDLKALIARISNDFADRGLAPRTRLFLNIADADLRLAVMLAAIHAGLIPFVLADRGDAGELGPHMVVNAGPPQTDDLAPDIVIDPALIAGTQGDPLLREFEDRKPGEVRSIGSTTGTTGVRKLVAQLVPPNAAITAAAGLLPGPNDRVMVTMGDATTAAAGAVRGALLGGAAHVRFPRDPEHALRLINFVGVTSLTSTPSTITALMAAMEEAGARCPSVKHIVLIGSLFHKPLVERVERNFDAVLSVVYGSTEAGVVSTGRVKASTFEVGYVGQLWPGVSLVSAGSRSDPGPVTVINAGRAFAPYYSKGRLIPSGEGSITLPDIGFMEGGNLYLLGRADEVFNASGNKTAFSIIEHALLAVPGVREVGIVGGNAIGDLTGLLVAVAGSPEPDDEMLRARVSKVTRADGSGAHIHIIPVASVPRNAMGKVDRDGVVRAYMEWSGRRSEVQNEGRGPLRRTSA